MVSSAPQPNGTTRLDETLIENAIGSAVRNVCRTMMRCDAAAGARVGEAEPDAGPRVFDLIGNVGFVGQINGLVYLCLSHSFAVHAVGTILGMSPAEVEQDGVETIRDAIGEVTNMVAGGFKNAFCDLGHPCKLTLPTIVCGRDLRVSCLKSSVRRVYRFDVQGHALFVEVHFAAE